MEFRFTAEEEKFRQEIREFLHKEAELIEKVRWEETIGGGWGPATWEFVRKAGAKGYLTPSWPKEYGGLGASHMQRYIIAEELAYHVGRLAAVGVGMAGPVILRFGTEAQKERFLPEIARGEVEYALGYTEPEAGSDLASLQMRAVRKDDHYIINGQKVFNTACHWSKYHWLAARTDPTAKKHRGISMFVVDLDSPGITIRPLIGLGKVRTNEVFYDNVRVPKENLVGDINRGFNYIMAALDFERMLPMGIYRRLLDELIEYVKANKVDGKLLASSPIIRQKLAQLAIELEVANLLYYRLAYLLDRGEPTSHQASMEKVFGTEVGQCLTKAGMQILGLYGQLQQGSKWVPLQGRVENSYRTSIIETIYAGTSEVQRNIIAIRGLGLPRH